MAAGIRDTIITVVISTIITACAWAYLAGGTVARTQTRLDDHERRIERIEQIQNDLAEIKATLRTIQAEQRILHAGQLERLQGR